MTINDKIDKYLSSDDVITESKMKNSNFVHDEMYRFWVKDGNDRSSKNYLGGIRLYDSQSKEYIIKDLKELVKGLESYHGKDDIEVYQGKTNNTAFHNG